MLLSRKRGRELLAESPSNVALRHHHHHHRLIDEKWFLRDLLDATAHTQHEEQRSHARRQVVEFLRRHNRIPEHATTAMANDARDNSLQMSRARMSSQELFLSVVLEWQRAEVEAQYAQPHGREEVYAQQGNAISMDGLNGYYSSASSSSPESESASASDASSDSELEDIQASHSKKQRQIPGVEEVSPTSVHNVPRQLTPLNLDYIVSPNIKMIGIYSPRSRQELLRKYMTKRAKRLSQNKVRYRVRKTLANARPRVKGRFVKTEQPLTAALAESMGGAPSITH